VKTREGAVSFRKNAGQMP